MPFSLRLPHRTHLREMIDCSLRRLRQPKVVQRTQRTPRETNLVMIRRVAIPVPGALASTPTTSYRIATPRRTARPGFASRTNSPLRITGTPFTTTCRIPTLRALGAE